MGRTKSEGMSLETGVCHWTSGWLASSSTRRAAAAAVVHLETLARSKMVSVVHFSSGNFA